MGFGDGFRQKIDALRGDESRGMVIRDRDQFDRFVDVQSVDTWDDVQELLKGPFGEAAWIFRGQPNQYPSGRDCRLDTSLERAVLRYRKAESEAQPMESYITSHPNQFEDGLRQKFQQRAHQYISNVPAEGEVLEWLALMQHHGVPTRLMDWTFSPYVALYFALEGSKSHKNCALWAINTNWLQLYGNNLPDVSDNKTSNESINRMLLDKGSQSTIIMAHPARMNERAASQQGVFLFDLGNRETFDLTLIRMLASYLLNQPSQKDNNEFEPESAQADIDLAKPPVCKIVLDTVERTRILKELRRMNIHAASLFPGLDGLARSLSLELQGQIDEAYEKIGWSLQSEDEKGVRKVAAQSRPQKSNLNNRSKIR